MTSSHMAKAEFHHFDASTLSAAQVGCRNLSLRIIGPEKRK